MFSFAKVAWLRVDTQTILTIQNQVITKNHRISVTNTERKIWQLRIREVKESDKGWWDQDFIETFVKLQAFQVHVPDQHGPDEVANGLLKRRW